MSKATRITCAVLGDGGWGTALAIHLRRCGHRVRWWGAFPDYLKELARRRVNRRYLPGVAIPSSIRLTPDLRETLTGARLILLAVPSQYLRGVARRMAAYRPLWREAVVVSAAKGLEHGSLKRMSQVLHEELGYIGLAALSGPSIASEVARGLPASIVVASSQLAAGQGVQRWVMSDRFRVYTSSDIIGVELGGALKNPLAIAAGICDGLGLGSNAKAALITRGVLEMSRLGVAMGAQAQTFWGLSGLGDLVTTCFAGRNRWLGEQLGKGRRLDRVLASTPMVIEGVDTAHAAVTLARRHRVELPIIEQVHAILNGRSPRHALHALMLRRGKAELR